MSTRDDGVRSALGLIAYMLLGWIPPVGRWFERRGY